MCVSDGEDSDDTRWTWQDVATISVCSVVVAVWFALHRVTAGTVIAGAVFVASAAVAWIMYWRQVSR